MYVVFVVVFSTRIVIIYQKNTVAVKYSTLVKYNTVVKYSTE